MDSITKHGMADEKSRQRFSWTHDCFSVSTSFSPPVLLSNPHLPFRRLLPFFESTYINLPTHRISGIFLEYRTELLPNSTCTVSGIVSKNGEEARFLLDDGKITGKLNRAALKLIPNEKFRLKIANGGPA
jgi:hypothetical protein